MVWVFLTPMHFPITDSRAAILKVLLMVGEIFLFHWETLQIFESHLWLGLQTQLVYQTLESRCMIPEYFVLYTSVACRSFCLSMEMCLLCNALQTAAEQVWWDNPFCSWHTWEVLIQGPAHTYVTKGTGAVYALLVFGQWAVHYGERRSSPPVFRR